MVQAGTEGNDTLTGYATDDVLDSGAGNDYIYGRDGNDTLSGGEGDDTLVGEAGDDVLDGGVGNDYLYGKAGNDLLQGGEGDDVLYGGDNYDSRNDGNDTLDGGVGNDWLSGGNGADTYRFGIGSGQDTINNGAYNYDAPGTNPDVIELGAGVTPDKVRLTRSGDHLLISLVGTTDTLCVSSYFRQDGTSVYAVEQIKFADGTVWDIAKVKQLTQISTEGNDELRGEDTVNDTLSGGGGNDSIYGLGGNDVLFGDAGHDSLYGGEGNDTLNGGVGDDRLYGHEGDDMIYGGDGNDSLYGGGDYGGAGGNDTLDGGSGNDLLVGGFGSDTYLFGKGDGQDTINNASEYWNGYTDPDAGKQDTLQFKAGMTAEDVSLSRNGNNLIIKVKDSSDRVTVQSYFANDGKDPHAYALEQIKFADGTVWDIAKVKQMVQAGTEGNDTLYGYAGNDNLDGDAGNDLIYGATGNDTLSGGEGSDQLLGEAGDDVLDGGAGNDDLSGGYGADLLKGGEGNDTLDGGAEDDVLDGGSGNDWLSGNAGADTYRFGIGSGQDSIRNGDSDYDALGTNPDVIELGAGVTADKVRLTRSGDDLLISLVGTTDTLCVCYYFHQDATSAWAVEQIKFADGTVWDIAKVKQMVQAGTEGNDTLTGYATADVINGNAGNDILYGRDGDDTLLGGGGNDSLQGELGNDVLFGDLGNDALAGGEGDDILDGGAGNDTLVGGMYNPWAYYYGTGLGNDLLQGGDGNDTLYDTAGTNLLDGGTGNDTLTGSNAADLLIGGQGDDTLTTVGGKDVLCFNRGDGQDSWTTQGNDDKTLSLGGGLSYADLNLSKSGNDLILSLGGKDKITFRSWYAGAQSIATLQMVAEAMDGFQAGGSDPLRDNKIETFDFKGLVGAFDQARAADPQVSTWALTQAMASFHRGGSDTAAVGGDLAYQYGRTGTLAGIGHTAAQSVINEAGFGSQAQTLQPLEVLQAGTGHLG